MNSKIGLAILLVLVSGCMVFALMFFPPKDSNALAIIVGLVTLFIKMAADACGYQFTSMAGADVKDQAQAKTIERLSSAVPAAAPVTPDALGEAMLTNGEKAYFQKLTDEEAKKAFLAMSAAERAETIGKNAGKV